MKRELRAAAKLRVSRRISLPTELDGPARNEGALFGIGWAVTGVCPGVALIQIGQGIWPAFITLAGIFSGIWIYGRLQKRLSLSPSDC